MRGAARTPSRSCRCCNNGKPRAEAEIDVGDAVATFDYYAGLAEGLDARQGEPVAMPDAAFAGKTRFEPVGPVGMIVPWNFPLVTSAWKIAPALAAGCTVVLKTSEFTPLIELAYGDIAQEAELPAGVLNLITGAAEAGAALTRDRAAAQALLHRLEPRRRRKVMARGRRALPAGLAGARAANRRSSSSPMPISTTPSTASPAASSSTAGQMCSATSRLIVDASIAPALLDRLVERARALRRRLALRRNGTEMGPITTRPQFEKVLRFLDQARADRLRLPAGGEGGATGGGFFVQPTIYADVPPPASSGARRSSARCWRCARFRPRPRRSRWRTTATTAWSPPSSAAIRRAPSGSRRGSTPGHVWINSLQVIFPNTAWGGFKASGIGRELGPWGLSAFLGVKHLTIATGGAA